MDLLTDPFASQFMQRALVAAALVSVVAAVVGSFVVLKGMAFVGDALPHASFGGVAVAFTLGADLRLGGAVAALLAALAVGFVTRRGFIRHDTAIGITLMGGFALGILLVSRQSGYTVDLFSFVFGNVLGVAWSDVWVILGLGGLVLALVVLFYKELLYTAYDPSMAAAAGVPVAAMHYGLLALVGLTVVIGLQVMGIVLILALLVAPAATAQLLARSLPGMMALAAGVGLLSACTGIYVAWYADVSASAAIVLTALGAFLIAFLLAPEQGLLWQYHRRGASPKGEEPAR